MSRLHKLYRTPVQFFRDSRWRVGRGFGALLARLAYGRDGAAGWMESLLPRRLFKHVGARDTDRRRALFVKHGEPLVTIVMAARNAAETIDVSVASILKQTYTNIELIVVDDASTDDTVERLKRLAAADSRVRVVPGSSQVGAARARNQAMQTATGDFLTFQDSDDTAHPERLERQLGALLRDPTAILCLCGGRRVDASGEPVWVNGRKDIKWIVSMMFPRERVMSQVGFLKPLRISEDSEYYERIKLAFQDAREIRLYKTLYFARYSHGSLLFSDGTVSLDDSGHVSHTRSAEVARVLEETQAAHEKIRRGELDAYVPFA